jgi:hypothetical protein
MSIHLDAVARADAFGRAELIDARAVDGPPPSLSELRRLAGRARDLIGQTPPGPRAIVVNGSPVNTLVAELFSVFMAGPMAIDVFTSEAAARRWLREQSCQTDASLTEGQALS